MATDEPVGRLSHAEMEKIRRVLGDTATPLIAAVARMFVAHPDGGAWQDANAWGAVVLVMDRVRHAKILRLYELKTCRVLFDEELYVGMNYVAARPYFHTFEVERGIIGLDFCDEADAGSFYSRVVSMIPRLEHIQKMEQEKSAQQNSEKSKNNGFLGQFKRALGFKKDNEISTMAIGQPTNVVHKQHIGFNANGEFDVKNVPDDWKAIFKKAGVKPSHLKDRETAIMMLDTIRQSVAVRAPSGRTSLKDSSIRPAPEHVARPPGPPPTTSRPARPPQPKPPAPGAATPPLDTRGHQVPPVAAPTRPSPPSYAPAMVPPPPLPAAAAAVPPPPPPPPPAAAAAVPPPPPQAPPPVFSSSDIKVTAPPPPFPPDAALSTKVSQEPSLVTSSSSSPARSNLLDEIRNFNGAKLTSPKVEHEGLPDLKNFDDDNKEDLMCRLKQMMDARRDILQQGGQNDDEDDEDEDEWD